MSTDRDVVKRLSGAGKHLFGGFHSLTEVQRQSIPLILAHRSVFIVSPTSSGKTEAALGPLLELRRREHWEGSPTILYIVPTRALVNDLFRRMVSLLEGYINVGRRTGEYREPDSDLLFTTPESLDSMLVRGRSVEKRHIFRNVQAVILDELHLLNESARGTQLHILLTRLELTAKRRIQKVALSATIWDADNLAKKYLGPEAIVVNLGGGRSLKVERKNGCNPIAPRPESGVDPLAREFWRADETEEELVIPRKIMALREQGPLKALLFVPSRKRCDLLSAALKRHFQGHCPVHVLAHHGSLSKEERENTEIALIAERESLVVATSTLELGVDIGDVNLVVLDGPPGSVSSLLQRIGRANRRENTVHLMPFVRNLAQGCTLASMVRAAVDGELDQTWNTCHYSVMIQQLASILRQAENGKISKNKLLSILQPTYGEISLWLLDELANSQWLRMLTRKLYGATVSLGDIMDNPFALHSNICGAKGSVPLIDSVTGEALVWVSGRDSKRRVVLAGDSYTLVRTPQAVELRSQKRGGKGNPLSYNASFLPVGRFPMMHLSRGLGLPSNSLSNFQGRWIHFGGALFARLLKISGIESGPLHADSDPRQALKVNLERIINSHWKLLESFCQFGPNQKMLPDTIRRSAVNATIPLRNFKDWLENMEISRLDHEQQTILMDEI